MNTVRLPVSGGGTSVHAFGAPAPLATASAPPASRDVFAAAHVVADPCRASAAGGPDQIDWDATLELRRDLWSLGLGVAEAMDTSQRGMGLDWQGAHELATRTLRAAGELGGRVVVGIGTDQITTDHPSLTEIAEAYLEQLTAIEAAGGDCVLMASRHLAAAATGPDDYLNVYDKVLSQARRPVILHWLGAVFDPALAGYWGHRDPYAAMDTVVDVMVAHADRVKGIKVSLLDPALEVRLRNRLPAGIRVYTGDDYNYVDMIAGDDDGHSDALLGAFAALGPYASAAFARLDAGDLAGFREILAPTEPLSRLIFTSPTRFYKVGVAWLAYLDGKQSHFRMIGGFETGRTLLHLADLVREADSIGLFADPERTAQRAGAYFAAHGIG
ncbi:dihydrodipicolinate synthase family protein [Gordonia sp. 'Campus']|uniref:dihydrodipicolinate synthase family protein n=1 Tax=Gordonia sp. 'Campus' TaxID=2915824 RepID=UPI001EE486C4|nr:dihydrodipicolinate synthase family protein [Gordonia sp. 'Campus']